MATDVGAPDQPRFTGRLTDSQQLIPVDWTWIWESFRFRAGNRRIRGRERGSEQDPSAKQYYISHCTPTAQPAQALKEGNPNKSTL